MKILVITGPPYSGKGTQCEILEKKLSYKHISTGDKIREEKAKGSAIGQEMKAYEEKGELVPDEVMKRLLGNIFDACKNEAGIILDGYPRTTSQVDTLLEFISERGEQIDLVINIEVPKEELLKRAQRRAEYSNRIDDQDAEMHFKRIYVFEQQTRPAIEYLKSKVKVLSLDGLGSIEEITKKIEQIII